MFFQYFSSLCKQKLNYLGNKKNGKLFDRRIYFEPNSTPLFHRRCFKPLMYVTAALIYLMFTGVYLKTNIYILRKLKSLGFKTLGVYILLLNAIHDNEDMLKMTIE